MDVVTRFAPSPTGFLHIGGTRTALFNWLFSRHHGGRFLLRIEDTDRKRSTPEAITAILDGLTWMGLEWDDEPVYQSARAERHGAVARELLDAGMAYHCYCTPEELSEMRETARSEGRPARYDGRWRDRDPGQAPPDIPPVVRFRAPRDGETVIGDLVQGEVRIANDQLDDMILLRSDGTPTYMLSVVVDDHDMGISHVIRGADHLTNAARQTQLYKRLDWQVPDFAHIPLIHGADGAKLSKRHGALGIEAYRDMGFLPEAMANYLLRLGWAHGDDEIISAEQAIEWFGLDHVGRSPARFDAAKLEHLNHHYLRQAGPGRLIQLVEERLAGADPSTSLGEIARCRLELALPHLIDRSKTVLELIENAEFCIFERPLKLDSKAAKLLDDEVHPLLRDVALALGAVDAWNEEALEGALRAVADDADVKFGKIAQPLRAALTGRAVSPGIFDVLAILGRDESLARIRDQVA